MSGLIAIAIAIGLFIFAAPAFLRRGVSSRLCFQTIVASFVFWYWLPAANLLTVQYVGVAFFQITASVDEACWIVLAAQIAVMAVMASLLPFLADSREDGSDIVVRYPLGSIALVSATLFLGTRFASEGTGVLVELATGLSSAREFISYENRSSGAGQSLMALWEIVSINVALIAFARHMLSRSLGSLDGAFAFGALAFLFVASGTRTVLLQLVFVALLCVLVRPRATSNQRTSVLGALIFAVPGLAAFGVIISGFTSRFATSGGYAEAGPLAAVLDTLFANNDMMRELAFVLDSMQPSTSGAADFALTPITYMLPTFLGFEKNLPYHLLAFNQARIGLDLNTGEGNVFPGLVADFWLLFEWAGPLVMAGFVGLSLLFIVRLSLLISLRTERWAYLVVSLSYVLFNFRNITGAFVLVLLTGVVTSMALVSASRFIVRPSAR